MPIKQPIFNSCVFSNDNKEKKKKKKEKTPKLERQSLKFYYPPTYKREV